MKNKYEDIKMIELEDKIYITDVFINHLYNTDKTVGVIANKHLVEYILDELISLDETSIKEIDLVDYMRINEYVISVNDDGHIICVPIEDYVVLDDMDTVYIDMDGDIGQDTIDYCVNEDKEVVLFGEEDDECENCLFCDGNCKVNDVASTSTASYSVNGKPVSKEEYEDKMAELDSVFREHMDNILSDYSDFVDEMNNWRRLFD